MSGYYHQLDQVWPSGNLIPIPVEKVTAFGKHLAPDQARRAQAGRPAGTGRRAVPQDLPRQLEEEVRHGRDRLADDDPRQPQLRLVRIQREGSRRQARLVGLALRQPLQGPRRAHQRPRHRLHRRRHGRQGLRQDDDEGSRRSRPRRRSTTSRRSSRISRRPATSRPSGRPSRSRCSSCRPARSSSSRCGRRP